MYNVKKPKLGNKPSQIINQAVKDLKAVEKSKKYRVNMDVFHQQGYKTETDVCVVCFAGAVMARAGNDPKADLAPHCFDDVTAGKLRALDSFRAGSITEGLEKMNAKIPLLLRGNVEDGGYMSVEITPYDEDKDQFKKDMTELAKNLEALGL